MSLLASIALAASGAASGAVLPHCSWDKPGVNPFMGDVVAAVDRYTDIPADTRARLKERMKKRDYDELVSIQRDGIVGKAQYGSEIRDMYFGANNVCKTVSRAKWSLKAEERGLVYCEDGQCILVPTVCRNVSRITRLPSKAAPVAAANSPANDSQAPLELEPTSAGPLATGGPAAPGSFAQLAGAGSGLEGLPPTSAGPLGTALQGPTTGATSVPSLPAGTATPQTVVPGVPEPGTWAMLLSGLFAVGFVARRRA
ncbi:MHFG family PEP-CTERM protein [Roseateles koreensis]|uniref:MHFG family PEP-CTERM protein n=1 Tax=Roseateles koreensis TaxID=2987526 RepID=A0ABT5KRY8_9BURK|nr:MHFG family PEP-CTERM protein [Roseateles koreensis]MDC8785681.1 MHFG family PEP-CTERM protein [Roseateles koreensis]